MSVVCCKLFECSVSVVCCKFECSVSVVFEVDGHDCVLYSGACNVYYYEPSALMRAEHSTVCSTLVHALCTTA